jgi:hypothetical protein
MAKRVLAEREVSCPWPVVVVERPKLAIRYPTCVLASYPEAEEEKRQVVNG